MSDEYTDVEIGEGEETPQFEPEGVFPDDDVKEQLIGYLVSEYSDITEDGERAELQQDWEEWRRISMVKPRERIKDEPWEGAANVVTPFTFSNINGVVSHLKAAIAEKRPRWQVTTGDADYDEHAQAVQRWINELMTSKLHINIGEIDETMMFDGVRMGSQFADVPWKTKRVQFKRRDSDGTPMVVDRIVYDGPTIVPHRLEDVIIRSHWQVQTAPYIGFVHHFTKQDLRQEEYNGFFYDVERVFSSPAEEERSRSIEKEQMGVSASTYEDIIEPGTPYEIIKFYVNWDADQDGVAEPLVVWIEPTSGVCLREEWLELGVRPAANGKYFNIPYIVYGLGVCAMLYRLQEEIDAMHNIGINSLHISSLQMYVTPTGSMTGPDEKFFPLKNIRVDDPSRDFVPIKFPNVSGETTAREMSAQQYGRTVTGISEVQLGMPDTTAKSGTSPTLQQFLAQQGNKVLRSIIASFADFYGELGQYVLLQMVANSDRVLGGDAPLLRLASEGDRPLIEEVLRMNTEDIPLRFQFVVKTTEADKTDDARRQMLMMKHQLFSQYMQQAMQIVQMLDNPQIQQMPTLLEFMTQMYVGQTRLMEESLELFDVEATDEYLPNVEIQDMMLQIADMMKEPQVAALKQRLQEARGEREGTEAEPGESGVFEPGYTAAENAPGNAGDQAAAAMAGRPAGGPAGGPAPQQPGPGVAGPRQGGGR